MSDFLSRMAARGLAPTPREVTILGETDTVYFKQLTAAQRHQLIGSRPITVTKGEAPTVTIDLSESEATKHKLVHFCVVDEAGRPVYKDVNAVRALPAAVVDALAAEAEKVNAEAVGKGEPVGEA